jgi:hypothetical protein
MDRRNKPVLNFPAELMWVNEIGYQDSKVQITDKRVARLLLVLHQLDESLGALEEIPKAELSDLVANAIKTCGFEDPVEARCAISAILEMIDVSGSIPHNSC